MNGVLENTRGFPFISEEDPLSNYSIKSFFSHSSDAIPLEVLMDFTWESVESSRQTLFPVYSLLGEPLTAHKGAPPPAVSYTLRATKRVNMYPYPRITIINSAANGDRWEFPEDIRISLVEASRNREGFHRNREDSGQHQPEDHPRVCVCETQGLIGESQTAQLSLDGCARIEKGEIIFKKLQIGCVSGRRGHGVPFQIRIEFVNPESLLFQRVIYSPSIEVGAKSPFAFIYLKGANLLNSSLLPQSGCLIRGTEGSYLVKRSAESYPGGEEISAILFGYGLEEFLPIFLTHEVDGQAFQYLTDESLIQMGIHAKEDRLTILQAVCNYLWRIHHEDPSDH
jgi:hypothetical protein